MLYIILIASLFSAIAAKDQCQDKQGNWHDEYDFFPGAPGKCCFCVGARIACATVVCPPTNCASPQVVPGLCCKECPNNKCSPVSCPLLFCANSVDPAPGECCRTCPKGPQKPEEPKEPKTDCSAVLCPRTDCLDPVPPPKGGCCGSCPDKPAPPPQDCSAVFCAQPDCVDPLPPPEGECCGSCPDKPATPNPDCSAVLCAQPDCVDPLPPPEGECCGSCPDKPATTAPDNSINVPDSTVTDKITTTQTTLQDCTDSETWEPNSVAVTCKEMSRKAMKNCCKKNSKGYQTNVRCREACCRSCSKLKRK